MFVGIDIGGTNTRIVTSESTHDVSFSNQISFSTSQDFKEGVEKIIEAINSLHITVSAIAIGVPGSVTNESTLNGSTNLSGWVHKPLKEKLTDTFKCPVYIKNDAEMGALGEAYFGQTEKKDFFYITWGTGVGCAQIVWNKDEALVSRPEDREPIYQLEHKIGGNNIKKKFGKSAQDLDDSQWAEILIILKDILPSLADNYDFKLLALGGGIPAQQQNRIQDVTKTLQHPEVLVTKLKGEAGLYGALALLQSNIS